MRFPSIRVLGVLLALAAWMPAAPAGAEPRTVRVAAASDLKFALDEIVAEFERAEPGIDVRVTYGSSGNFFAQLGQKAPFDIFFSADIEYPRRLVAAKKARAETLFSYAIGQVVVWAPKNSSLDPQRHGMQTLADARVRKIAIANPKHAPYGKAAEAAMKHLGVYEQVQGKLVLGENISQTAQFVASGAADVGIIALSLAMAPALRDRGRSWPIPLDAYPKLEQGGVILSWATDRGAAEKVREFVIGPRGREILARYGFRLPAP